MVKYDIFLCVNDETGKEILIAKGCSSEQAAGYAAGFEALGEYGFRVVRQ